MLFESFERREFDVVPTTDERATSLFDDSRWIETDLTKADRVLSKLQKQVGKKKSHELYRVFLSEDPQVWRTLYIVLQRIFTETHPLLDNYGDPNILYLSQMLKKVNRERHRMQAFVRFSKSEDGLYTAVIEPDFDVLPLIGTFFQQRFSDQPWLIYDIRRGYGLHYDLVDVREIELSVPDGEMQNLPTNSKITLDPQEAFFQRLWQRYFKSTTIEARKNLKLHLRHVPKRYWKYLTEKS